MATKKKKAPTPNEKLVQLRISYMEERNNWEFIYQYGCRDPFWPDGTNLNLIRNHCIADRNEMQDLCAEYSLPMPELPSLPEKVDEDFMAAEGRFPDRLRKSRPELYEPMEPVQLELDFGGTL